MISGIIRLDAFAVRVMKRFSVLATVILLMAEGWCAGAEIVHSTLSPHISVVEQSPGGMTIRMAMPRRAGTLQNRERALIAIPPGTIPSIRPLNYSSVAWKDGRIQSESGLVDLQARPNALEEIASQASIVRITPLGLMRDVRLASLEIMPYHRSRQTLGEETHQIETLTLRLDFTSQTRPAGAEPDFGRGFPSGFRGMFEKSVLNAAAMPSGTPGDRLPDSSFTELPYMKQPSIRLETAAEGVYAVQADSLRLLQETLPSPGQIALYHQRREIPLLVLRQSAQEFVPDNRPQEALSTGDVLVFFAPLSDSPYSAESVFFLTLTGGKERGISVASPGSAQAIATARVHHQVEQNRALWSKQDKAKDHTQHEYWIWKAVDSKRSFSHRFELPGSLDTRSAKPSVLMRMIVLPDLQTQAFNLSGYRIQLAGKEILGEHLKISALEGSTIRMIAETQIPFGGLDAGNPVVEFSIEAVEQTASPGVRGFSIDYFVFEYDRTLELDQKVLEFAPGRGERRWRIAAPVGTVDAPVALAVDNGKRLYALPIEKKADALETGLGNLKEDVRMERIWVAGSPTELPKPKMEFSPVSTLRSKPGKADMIIITHPELSAQVERLADYRRSQGYRVEQVLTPDIYKYFGDGSLSPLDIKEFLRHAYHHWEPPRPTYVLLVGEARWDYWGFLDVEIPNHVPSYHPVPAYASDNWYACIEGEDALPEFLISRISVADTTAANIALGKIIEYETLHQPGAWQGRVLFVSDNEKVFEDESDRQIREKIPLHFKPTHLRLREFPFVDNYFMSEDVRKEKRTKYSPQCNQAILDHLEQGQLLWEYYGHGSPNVFAEERIFFGGGSRFSDVKRMRNRSFLPVLVALTCDTIQFDYAGEVGPQWALCMGEELLVHPDGGAVAVYGATGRGYTTHHVLLNNGFHDALFVGGFRTLGELMTLSKLYCYAEQQIDEPLDMFGLLGDVLTTISPAERGFEVSVKGSPLMERTGGNLEVEVDLSRIASRQLRNQAVRLYAQDHNGFRFLDNEETRLRSGRMKFQVTVPPEASPGAGRIGALLYPRQAQQGSRDDIFGGGVGFQVKRRQKPTGYPADALPDLMVSSGGVRVSPASPRDGETVFMDVDVTNRGNAPASDIEIAAYNGHPESGGVVLEDRGGWMKPVLPLLLPGETQTIRLRWDPFMNAGSHEIYVVVDPDNRIQESNKENNRLAFLINVRKKVDLALFQEDFSLTRIDSPPGYLLQAGVRNIGETPSEPCALQVFAYQTEDPEEEGREFRVESMPSIPPQRRARFPMELPPDTVRIQVIVDPEESQDEETHKNNRLTLTVRELLASSPE